MADLKGKTFCFTGKLDSMTRKEAQELVEKHGGVSKSSVVKNLTYLVSNSDKETTKIIKAKEQGTKIITEKQFLELIK
ncbi:MAG: hypothetical protein BAJALOKI1v1_220026 [Promethearchaeota archaeon]|nr:MAG: hypothetical protein BAJALOKI1v1_220026 [Candidatus Lokiarchaeota archaeon]